MRKFQATYRVTVYSDSETVIVKYPITCKFNVTRGLFSESTKATIQLYNLAPTTRNLIFQDKYVFDRTKWKYVHLEAGYGSEDSMSLIFKGRILQAYSFKSGGQTDVITEIQAMALDIFDCPVQATFEAGTSIRDIYKQVATFMPNVKVTNLGALNGTIKTPLTISGNAIDQLNQLTGGNTFVDNGMLNTIMANEVIDVPVPVIQDDNALLETPRRREANLDVKMLFEPTLIVGQLLELRSRIYTDWNGQFKVIGFTHDCLISPTQAGTRTTSVNLWIGPYLPNSDVALTSGSGTASNSASTGGGTATGGAAPVPSFDKVKGDKVSSVLLTEPSEVRQVFDYIQKYGKAPHTQITKNIWWDEVVKFPSLSYGKPGLKELVNVSTAAKRLQRFVNKYYNGARIQINSAWRSKGYNSTLPLAHPNSEHLYGNAIDFMLIGYNIDVVYNTVKKVWAGRKYMHNGRYGRFIHVDITSSRGVYAKFANDL